MKVNGGYPSSLDGIKLISSLPYIHILRGMAESIPLYLVGGSLRDLLLKRKVHDWDIVVEGDARAVSSSFAHRTNSHFVPLDEEYKIYRVIPKEGDFYIDFAQSRGGILEDLSLRDFTINAIAVSLRDGRILDPTGGVEDLFAGVIRVCRRRSLIDDPLRILRAYRLKAQLYFTLDPLTREWIPVLAEGLKQVSFERIRDEIYKILETDRATSIMKSMFEDGVLSIILPEFVPMVGLRQNRFHKYDVFDHSFCTLEEFENIKNERFCEFGFFSHKIEEYLREEIVSGRSRLPTVKFAILLHDVGKPSARRVEKGGIYYIGHHTIGGKIWRSIGRRFKLSRKEINLGQKMIEHHLDPIFISMESNLENRRRKMYRFFRDAKEVSIAILLLSWADVEAGQGEALTQEMIRTHHDLTKEMVKMYFSKDKLAFPPKYVDGRDVKRILHIPNGKDVGDVLERLREEIALGLISSPQEALNRIEEIGQELGVCH